MEYLLGIIAVFIIIFIYYFRKKQIQKIQSLDLILREEADSRYITQKTFDKIIKKYNSIPFKSILFADRISLNKKLENGFAYHQNSFIEQEKIRCKNLFDTIEENPLTEKQRESCIIMEENNLVLAGAGTGKTSVMIGRVQYLIKEKNINPDKILMLTFSRAGALEMQERIEKKLGKKVACQIKIKTFHSLAKEISNIDKDPIDSEKLARPLIFNKLEENREESLEYIKNQIYEEKENGDNKEQYFRYNEGNEIKTYKNEIVKSQSERRIANWLLQMGINYIYEEKFKDDKENINYSPDFYLPDYNIYIEFFGVGQNNKTREDINSERYIKDMEWKKAFHEKKQSKFIALHYYQIQDGSLFDYLRKKLNQYGVETNKQSVDKIWDVITKSYVYKDLVNIFEQSIGLVKIALYKNNTQNINEQLLQLSGLELFANIYDDYQKNLEKRNLIDFNDMLIYGVESLKNDNYIPDYEHILVDEFQDTSDFQADFLKLLRDRGQKSTLFCVGDDWQAIYRFQGGNVKLITEFKNYFGNSSTVALDKTFRFNSNILNVANKFIMENPNQAQKIINAHNDNDELSVILLSCEGFLSNYIKKVIATIKENDKNGKILILARLNGTLSEIKDSLKNKKYNNIKLSSIHGSKGLESDYVIFVGANIPHKKKGHELIDTFLPDECRGISFADERRLFYVALTRAKKKIYIISMNNNPSEFIKELDNESYEPFIDKSKYEKVITKKCRTCGGTQTLKPAKAGYKTDYWLCTNKRCISGPHPANKKT